MRDHATKPNLLAHIEAIATQKLPADITDPLAAAHHLSGTRVLQVYVPENNVRPELDEQLQALVNFVEDPDDSDITLIVHTATQTAAHTAHEAETQVALGRRVMLVDLSHSEVERTDPDLLIQMTNSTVYVSNLAAYDINLHHAIAVALTPLRDGAAHRRYLVETMLYYWVWRSIVIDEVARFFDEIIPEGRMLRATTQAKSRLGAYLMRLHRRGLRFFVQKVGFNGNRVDGFWFELSADA